eukprot:4767107-Pyramimonas_sp.AAC.1
MAGHGAPWSLRSGSAFLQHCASPGPVPAFQAGLRRHLGSIADPACTHRWCGPGLGAPLATRSSFTLPVRPPNV